MNDPKKNQDTKDKNIMKSGSPVNEEHLGSSNAFEETENPYSEDSDNMSDEKLDELLDEPE